MAVIQNISKVKEKFREVLERYEKKTVVVGYAGVNYALYVHENMEANYRVGQAKFLEEPARTESKKIANIIKRLIQKGVPLNSAMLIAGKYLQRVSQELTPIDTGNLRGSAFTDFEEELDYDK